MAFALCLKFGVINTNTYQTQRIRWLTFDDSDRTRIESRAILITQFTCPLTCHANQSLAGSNPTLPADSNLKIATLKSFSYVCVRIHVLHNFYCTGYYTSIECVILVFRLLLNIRFAEQTQSTQIGASWAILVNFTWGLSHGSNSAAVNKSYQKISKWASLICTNAQLNDVILSGFVSKL